MAAVIERVRELRALGYRTEVETEEGLPVEITEAAIRGVPDNP